ncbi:hypothetical protein B0T26DRAFT_624713, partial [Lasiosphaeria miniovina]
EVIHDCLDFERAAYLHVDWRQLSKLEMLFLDCRGYSHGVIERREIVDLARALRSSGMPLRLLVIAGLRSYHRYPGSEALTIDEVESGVPGPEQDVVYNDSGNGVNWWLMFRRAVQPGGRLIFIDKKETKMAQLDEKRGPRPATGRGLNKGAATRPSPLVNLWAPLFGSRTAPVSRASKTQSGRDRDRDRDRHRDEGPGRTHHRAQPRPYVKVELMPLDPRYTRFELNARVGLVISKVIQYIFQRYAQRKNPVSPAAQIRLYSGGQELGDHDTITPEKRKIWYSMSRPEDAERWKFTHWQDETNGRLDGDLTDGLVSAIEAGATVGELRRKIADHMGIADAQRIVLIGRDGMRPGLLQGNSWVASRIKGKWCCRWIAIDVNPEKCYVILKGQGREYVYHPDPSYVRRGLDLMSIRTYMALRIFPYICPLGAETKLDLPRRSIALSLGDEDEDNGDGDDGCLASSGDVSWGATYRFELPADAAEVFSDEETWLLPKSETCSICIEDKSISELPVKVTAECTHKPTACKDCLKQWLASGLESGTWDRLKCPDCSQVLAHGEVKRFASGETFVRYDGLATRAALKDVPNFRWCLSTTCESGQIHDDTCPTFKCAACDFSHCVAHDVPWHKGETCDEYDRRNRQRKKQEKASEDMIKKTSKNCPECNKAVHKYTGCNHITCVCSHEWCYKCLAPFQRNEHGFLYCHHRPTCTERDPFADLVDPAGAGAAG